MSFSLRKKVYAHNIHLYGLKEVERLFDTFLKKLTVIQKADEKLKN